MGIVNKFNMVTDNMNQYIYYKFDRNYTRYKHFHIASIDYFNSKNSHLHKIGNRKSLSIINSYSYIDSKYQRINNNLHCMLNRLMSFNNYNNFVGIVYIYYFSWMMQMKEMDKIHPHILNRIIKNYSMNMLNNY
jgi:hypothetical protein